MRSLLRPSGLRLSGAVAAALLAAAATVVPPGMSVSSASAADGQSEQTPDQTFTIKDPRIVESSGLAASRLHPGIYWTHNDSDDGPYVFAVDSRTGETVAMVTMRGVGEPRDVEAISIGSDGNVYVGDIGDNLNGSWDHVWIYRFPEPKRLADTTVRATQFTVTYADGPRNAEALMVHPVTGRVYIASKNDNGGGLYEGPARLSSSGNNVFRRIGEVPWVTDGAFSPDGKELVLRSYFSARAYAWRNGALGADHAVRAPFQAQAESVTYTADGKALMFGSEGKDSEVVREDLDNGKGDGSANSPSREGGSTTPGNDAGATGGSGSKGSATLGVFILAGGAALFFGFRRLRAKK
ncbi:WD40 repeat domain-containing protein [Streptomyces sp. GMY02]|uniref:WD40 repeat domain-containing protein n=1 Tax=Streptomyces sp. GMY02 TaxID=1333528 RepID=UPI001C2BE3D7|nr:WD40 repeat domain-containing protein [Streptomyces sp. GMY02]QXE36304.1 WD40 repeat domain-containing protein [Streptomyces sp. GMY02]